ncbi:D-ribose ABC transporter, substrate-binding protein [Candidatus Moduliflexus flocculans]|uniref:D-ribose ABC transporter, substrate-binding protein n=1 Tax=Candidatus Moduliflexus flocculans TaxID=1499966 RepID=A0A081BRH6_9BACT|nr:D-ribose ABC transporter, substrate-binding protein [Candidatus Moduliflexus flocculans]
MKKIVALVVMCVVGLMVVNSLAFAADPVKIGAILLDTKHEWFAEVIQGMKSAGKELGVEVKIMSSDSDVAKESDLIDNFIAQGINAISISPQSDEASVPAFERAVAEGIPVVTWNSKVNSPESKYFVGVNNYDLGAKTGEYTVNYIKEKMNGKAKIAVIGTSKYSVGIDRVKGFVDQVKQLEGVEIVAQQDAEFKELGLSVTESILEAHPETQIVWCWNQGALLGSLAALKGKGNKDILLMGTDMSIDLARAMLEPDSFLLAITTQQPFEIGYTSIKNAAELAQTGKTATEVLVPLKTYTLDNKEDIQKYLDDRQYLMQ